MCIQACGAGHSLEDVNCCSESFAAAPGWDAATGLGTPNFDILSNLVINNASSFASISAYPDIGVTGTSSSSDSSNDDDDDDDNMYKDIATAALVISVVSMCIALVAMYQLYMRTDSDAGNGLLKVNNNA